MPEEKLCFLLHRLCGRRVRRAPAQAVWYAPRKETSNPLFLFSVIANGKKKSLLVKEKNNNLLRPRVLP